jgi:voltage-gated potassium channel
MLFGQTLTIRRAARIIATSSAALTLVGGLAAWLLNRRDFHTFGDSLWWALQTVTTVGYGDIVPRDTLGRLIGAALMLNGIALAAVITAAVTATFIERARRERSGADDEVLTRLKQIESRLDQLQGGRDE